MANEAHLARLWQGVDTWNRWRDESSEIRPDLREADLREVDLSEALLRKACLSGADLSGTYLAEADFREADLSGALLSGADLSGALLSKVLLSGAYSSDATIGWTILADVDLNTVQGLDTIEYYGPSAIGIDTLYRSHGNIPEVFLRGLVYPMK